MKNEKLLKVLETYGTTKEESILVTTKTKQRVYVLDYGSITSKKCFTYDKFIIPNGFKLCFPLNKKYPDIIVFGEIKVTHKDGILYQFYLDHPMEMDWNSNATVAFRKFLIRNQFLEYGYCDSKVVDGGVRYLFGCHYEPGQLRVRQHFLKDHPEKIPHKFLKYI